MEYDTIFYLLYVIVGIVIGLTFSMIIFCLNDTTPELGNAICSEKHLGKFISYEDKIVKCEKEPKYIPYDGIRIEVD